MAGRRYGVSNYIISGDDGMVHLENLVTENKGTEGKLMILSLKQVTAKSVAFWVLSC